MPSENMHGRRGPFRALDPVWGLRVHGDGGYFRALPGLEPLRATDAALDALADRMRDEVPTPQGGWSSGGQPQHDDGDNPTIPAGYTYIGQFLDHDITFDAGAEDHRLNRLAGKVNFRTPMLDLDSVYGLGPHVQPYLYDGPRLRVDGDDLPRVTGDTAVIGDPRNDENAIVARVQLAVIGFHNAMVDRLEGEGVAAGQLFELARRLTRWCYQYATVTDYLARTIGTTTLNAVLRGPRVIMRWPTSRALPIEFAGAAFRFGHSQIRPQYQLAEEGPPRPIFGPAGADLRGGQPLALTAPFNWNHLVGTAGSGEAIQPTRKIDTRIATALFGLFGDDAREPAPLDNLARRNLRKGVLLGLPSGQAIALEIARRLNEAATRPAGLAPAEDLQAEATRIRDHAVASTPHTAHGTPAWFWLLEEAQLLSEGQTLGPVGGRLVGETFVAMLENDPDSYWSQRPFFAPTVEGEPLGWPHLLAGTLPDELSDVHG